jgi:hypothetical protein
MKTFYLKTIFCFFSILCMGWMTAHAQELPTASGGDATGSGGSASYSIGQITYTTNTGTSASVAQGVQQPYEISITTGQDEAGIDLNLAAYPNPTSDLLVLQIDDSNASSFSYALFDANGKMVDQHEITNCQTQIDIEFFPVSTYFLKVIQNGKEVKTFSVLKTK